MSFRFVNFIFCRGDGPSLLHDLDEDPDVGALAGPETVTQPRTGRDASSPPGVRRSSQRRALWPVTGPCWHAREPASEHRLNQSPLPAADLDSPRSRPAADPGSPRFCSAWFGPWSQTNCSSNSSFCSSEPCGFGEADERPCTPASPPRGGGDASCLQGRRERPGCRQSPVCQGRSCVLALVTMGQRGALGSLLSSVSHVRKWSHREGR